MGDAFRRTKSTMSLVPLVVGLLTSKAWATLSVDECTTKALQIIETGAVNASQPICGTYLRLDSIITTPQISTASNSSTSLSKRQCPSLTYTQTQVVQTGLWWDVWAPDHDCLFCGLSNNQCGQGLTWSDSETVSYGVGFDVSVTQDVENGINKEAKFNFGYSWTSTKTNGGITTCTASPGSSVQIWVQNQKGWSDHQTRKVTYQPCVGAPKYTPWSPYQHADWPLGGGGTMNLGCSTGANSGC